MSSLSWERENSSPSWVRDRGPPRPRRWSVSPEKPSYNFKSWWKALLPISLFGNIYIGRLYFCSPPENASGITDNILDQSNNLRRDDAALNYLASDSDIRVPDWVPLVDLVTPSSRSLSGSSMWGWSPNRHLSSSSSSSGGSSSSSSSGSSTHGSSGHSGPHQHDALLFLFNIVLVGTGVLHLASIYHQLQLSITLFVIGVVTSLILEGAKAKDEIGVFGESYSMWMDIDPHLLLFTMLPTLLAGDAMTIDTSVARRVGKQCLYLAGPGVMLLSFICAIFLQFWFNWSFLLSMTTAAILCATDPVAVVALLKELGASPTLTVQIQGESLLNDGTAIVLYTIAYNMLSGESYDVADIAMFLVKTAVMAVALGVFLGFIFFSWIRATSDKFNHASPVIQILLTLCAAYWSFVLAEGVFKMSGVLATVACSIVLAHHMWPYVVEREAMLDFWHVFENLGNIIIFLLGGALTGAAMVKIEAVDYLNLIVVYIFLTIARGTLIFGSRPILKFLHKDKEAVTFADALVMTWGGLRGAVGLALAIQVRRGMAVGSDGLTRIDESDAERVLFFVGGIAFLTTCVNATTCPMLVDWLGITNLPQAEAALLQKFNAQVICFSAQQGHPKEVTKQVDNTLAGIAHEIAAERTRMTPRKSVSYGNLLTVSSGKDAKSIVASYRTAIEEIQKIRQDDLVHLPSIQTNSDEQVESMISAIETNKPDLEISKAINNIFLTMVNTAYTKQIRSGNLKPGSEEAEILTSSVRFSQHKADLVDFKFLTTFVMDVKKREEEKADFMGAGGSMRPNTSNQPTYTSTGSSEGKQSMPVSAYTSTLGSKFSPEPNGFKVQLGLFVTSTAFNLSCALAIVFNVSYVLIEEVARGDDDNHFIWIVMEGIFTVVFLAEFILKFLHLKFRYFMDGANCFDFSLVVLGMLGFVMSLMAANAASGSSSGMGSESRIIRISRVLRTMRFLRLFRLFHANWGNDPLISEQLARSMKQLQAMTSFIEAHLSAQHHLVKFFANTIDDGETELSRCIVQSHISVYAAAQKAVLLLGEMRSHNVLMELRNVRERKRIIEELEEFVDGALKNGAINETNAGALLHPLQHALSQCIEHVYQFRLGRHEIVHRRSQQEEMNEQEKAFKLASSLKGVDSTASGAGMAGKQDRVARMFAEAAPVVSSSGEAPIPSTQLSSSTGANPSSNGSPSGGSKIGYEDGDAAAGMNVAAAEVAAGPAGSVFGPVTVGKTEPFTTVTTVTAKGEDPASPKKSAKKFVKNKNKKSVKQGASDGVDRSGGSILEHVPPDETAMGELLEQAQE